LELGLCRSDSNGRTIWIADAHHGDGKRFVVRADEKLTAFLELKSPIRGTETGANRMSSACKKTKTPKQSWLQAAT